MCNASVARQPVMSQLVSRIDRSELERPAERVVTERVDESCQRRGAARHADALATHEAGLRPQFERLVTAVREEDSSARGSSCVRRVLQSGARASMLRCISRDTSAPCRCAGAAAYRSPDMRFPDML